jgi:hypothetical protein
MSMLMPVYGEDIDPAYVAGRRIVASSHRRIVAGRSVMQIARTREHAGAVAAETAPAAAAITVAGLLGIAAPAAAAASPTC